MPRDTCFYDAQCGLCRRTVRVLRALDWLRRLEFVDMNRAADLPVDPALAMQGMPMRTAGGRVLVGLPAVRRALMQTPLGASLAWALYLPGVSAVADRVYRWVAVHRRRDAACEVAP